MQQIFAAIWCSILFPRILYLGKNIKIKKQQNYNFAL